MVPVLPPMMGGRLVLGGLWSSCKLVEPVELQMKKMVMGDVSPGLHDTFGMQNTDTGRTPFNSALDHVSSTTKCYKFRAAVDLNGGRSLCPARLWVDPPPLIPILV